MHPSILNRIDVIGKFKIVSAIKIPFFAIVEFVKRMSIGLNLIGCIVYLLENKAYTHTIFVYIIRLFFLEYFSPIFAVSLFRFKNRKSILNELLPIHRY